MLFSSFVHSSIKLVWGSQVGFVRVREKKAMIALITLEFDSETIISLASTSHCLEEQSLWAYKGVKVSNGITLACTEYWLHQLRVKLPPKIQLGFSSVAWGFWLQNGCEWNVFQYQRRAIHSISGSFVLSREYGQNEISTAKEANEPLASFSLSIQYLNSKSRKRQKVRRPKSWHDRALQ